MRRLIIWITLFCFVTTQSAAIAGPFEAVSYTHLTLPTNREV